MSARMQNSATLHKHDSCCDNECCWKKVTLPVPQADPDATMARLGFDLHALEIFSAVCELRSMTRAARRLGLTQPAVSHAVKQLEAVLGSTLIDRDHRPLTPTTAGYWLAEASARILADTRHIPLAMRQLDRGLAVRLRIGIVDSLSVPFVPLMVRHLQSTIQYLSINSGMAPTLRRALLDHSLDLIITNDEMTDIDGLTQHLVLTEPYIAIVPQAMAAHTFDPLLLSENLPLIRFSAQSQTAADIESQLRRMKLNIPRRFEFDVPSTILGMVAEGLGWAVATPLSIYEGRHLLPRIRMVPFPGPAFSRRVMLFTRAGEIDRIALKIAEVSRDIVRTHYRPEILRTADWLNARFLVEAEVVKV